MSTSSGSTSPQGFAPHHPRGTSTGGQLLAAARHCGEGLVRPRASTRRLGDRHLWFAAPITAILAVLPLAFTDLVHDLIGDVRYNPPAPTHRLLLSGAELAGAYLVGGIVIVLLAAVAARRLTTGSGTSALTAASHGIVVLTVPVLVFSMLALGTDAMPGDVHLTDHPLLAIAQIGLPVVAFAALAWGVAILAVCWSEAFGAPAITVGGIVVGTVIAVYGVIAMAVVVYMVVLLAAFMISN